MGHRSAHVHKLTSASRAHLRLPRRLLGVMVLVHVRINGPDVQRPVQYRVEEIVDEEERRQRQQRRPQGNLVHAPQDILRVMFRAEEAQEEVHERARLRLADADEQLVLRRELVEVLPPRGDRLRTEPLCIFRGTRCRSRQKPQMA